MEFEHRTGEPPLTYPTTEPIDEISLLLQIAAFLELMVEVRGFSSMRSYPFADALLAKVGERLAFLQAGATGESSGTIAIPAFPVRFKRDGV